MFAWIAENILTIIVIVIMLIVIGFALFSVIKNKKNKSCGCSGDCSKCGMKCSCDKEKE